MTRRSRRRPFVGETRQHQTTRTTLRTLGLVLTIAGAIGTLMGLVSFFGGFFATASLVSGGGAAPALGPPKLFFCAFAGLPMLGVGLSLLGRGYAGRIARYHANAYTPVVRDTLNTLAEETRPAQRAVRRVLREPGVTADTLRCPECGGRNDEGANFCAGCGSNIARADECLGCGAELAADAAFCSVCGESADDR